MIAVSDPLGNSITNVYDANGNKVALIDQVGQRWSKTCDWLNRVIAEADPQWDTKRTTYDPVGRIKVVTTPNGYPSTHFYDGRGRLTKWVDAENYQWLYDYDGNANITNITDALNGHYTMAYGLRNERTLERNQDHFEWRYTYDELLRLKQQTDPNGTTRTPNYDAAGRVTNVVFNTGRINSFLYDANDNPIALTRSQGGVSTPLNFAYDVMDRVTSQTSVASIKAVDYVRDALGRVATLRFAENKALTNRYDALGRLTNQVDWAGRQMTSATTRRTVCFAAPIRTASFNPTTSTLLAASLASTMRHQPLTPTPSTLLWLTPTTATVTRPAPPRREHCGGPCLLSRTKRLVTRPRVA